MGWGVLCGAVWGVVWCGSSCNCGVVCGLVWDVVKLGVSCGMYGGLQRLIDLLN